MRFAPTKQTNTKLMYTCPASHTHPCSPQKGSILQRLVPTFVSISTNLALSPLNSFPMELCPSPPFSIAQSLFTASKSFCGPFIRRFSTISLACSYKLHSSVALHVTTPIRPLEDKKDDIPLDLLPKLHDNVSNHPQISIWRASSVPERSKQSRD